MSKKKPNISAQVRSLVEQPIKDMGYSLWDVTFYKEGADLTLEIAIDKKDGVSLEDCSRVTKVIEPLIDELDPVEEGYFLMVSSAGSDRELRTAEHIGAAIDGSLTVTLKLYSAFEGKKEYVGVIKSADTDIITVSNPEGETALPRKLISKMTALFVSEQA